MEQAIEEERVLLQPIKDIADFIIDTSLTPASKFKKRIKEAFEKDVKKHMLIQCMSFGFKNGLPPEADLVLDVRCLPNPFYVKEMRERTGLEPDVAEFVIKTPQTQGFLQRLEDMLEYLLPMYIQEGKTQLVVAIGCTGGKHRSVAVAQYIYESLKKKEMRTSVIHRDMDKPNNI